MNELLVSPHQLGWIVVRTVVVYVFVLAGLRLTGKREVGQLAPFDFALILLIANAVQNAMVGPDSSLAGGLVAAGALLLVNHLPRRGPSPRPRPGPPPRGLAQLLLHPGRPQPDRLGPRRPPPDARF